MEQKKLTPEQKRQLTLTARNLKAKRELKERNKAKEATELDKSKSLSEEIIEGKVVEEQTQEHENTTFEKTSSMKYQSKAHQEVTEAKMKSIAEWQKKPRNWEEIDKQTQEMFEDHGQINPNKKANHEITVMDEAQIQKMQEYNKREKIAVAEMMKSPMSSEEMDRMIQEHYEVHNQVNPNKKRIKE